MKVSAVAVASLAFGTFTAIAPAQGAEKAAAQTVNITLANVNSSNVVNALQRINFMANMTNVTDQAANDTATFQAALISHPTNGFVQITAVADATGLDLSLIHI